MSEKNPKKTKKEIPTVEKIEKTLQGFSHNARKLGLADFAVRQIARVDPREFNVVFTDKDFLKKELEKLNEINAIYDKLMVKIGSEEFLPNLTSFKEKIEKIEKASNDLIKYFYEKNIGYGPSIKEWKSKNPQTEQITETEEK